MKPTALLYDERYLAHDTGAGHPERPQRLSFVWEYLQKKDFFPSLLLLKPNNNTLHPLIGARRAGPLLEWIELVHNPTYVLRVKESCERGDPFIDSMDSAICPASYETALLAAGGVIRLADAVMKGEARNGFALIRPPGHHAEWNQSLGFCLFNNIAIAARYIQKQYGIQKILIVDWDVHHGNGTQHSFEEDPSVFYFSAHQFPYYPGTGRMSEKGTGPGTGHTLNLPFPGGTTETEYLDAFEKIFLPATRQFKPEFILISAGFDAHQDDPLADLNLTERAYAQMTLWLKDLAKESAKERIVSILEGGYNLEALARSIEAHLRALRQ